MITVERHPIRGHYVVTAQVKDSSMNGAWILSRIYDGYNKKESVSAFRRYCRESGKIIVRGW
jgi:hypothetical protein